MKQEKKIKKERKRVEIAIEVIKLAHKYRPGQAFLVGNGDSQRFWELVKKIKPNY